MQPRAHARFDAGELAVVLSHFDLGVIESVTDFPRGSRRSPKVGIVCEVGKFLLKRRSLIRAHPDRIRFTHTVQQHLIEAGFPAPKLVPTRRGEAFLQLREHVYELFEFLAGEPYRRTVEETREAGTLLARFHVLAEPLASLAQTVPGGDFHDAPGVRTGLCGMGSTLTSHDSFTGDDAELATLVQTLLEVYGRSVNAVNAGDPASWPVRLIHADWHPGNLVFRNRQVVGVIDYDAMRRSPRLIDVANGALQFSMMAGGDPATWPDELDEDRYRAFLGAYESVCGLTDPERRCMPPLMIEALIAECVAPITQTGSVGRWSGYRVLQMVRRKVAWVERQAKRLVTTNAPHTEGS